jgi:hypothetical protein
MKVRPISVNEFRWLKSAIDSADTWRGTLTGNPDPGPLEEHDNNIAEMRAVLDRMRAVNKEYRNLRLLFERGQI